MLIFHNRQTTNKINLWKKKKKKPKLIGQNCYTTWQKQVLLDFEKWSKSRKNTNLSFLLSSVIKKGDSIFPSKKKVYFRIVLDLAKSYEDSIGSSHVPCTQFSVSSISSVSVVHLSQLMNQHGYIIITQSSYFVQIPLVFTSCPFSVIASHPGYHITLSCHVSLDSSWL